MCAEKTLSLSRNIKTKRSCYD